MPRATNKVELIGTARQGFAHLSQLIGSMSVAQLQGGFGQEMANKGKETHWGRDKNLRDVLVHLHEWHLLILDWVEANRQGHHRPFIPAPYNWKTYPKLNEHFREKHQNTSVQDAIMLLQNSHEKVMDLIGTFGEEELFSKKVFPWTGSTTLGSYCVSATASHYGWAMKKLNMYLKMELKP